MAVQFTSVYYPLAHGAVNWDTQLRTDIQGISGIINGLTNLGSGANLNGYAQQGNYIGYSMTNAPSNLTDTFIVQVLALADNSSAVQIAYRMTVGSFQVYRRFYVSGSGWNAWAAA